MGTRSPKGSSRAKTLSSPWKALDARAPPAGFSAALVGLAAIAAVAALASLLTWASMTGLAPPFACGPACPDKQLSLALRARSATPSVTASEQSLAHEELASSPFNAGAWLKLAASDGQARGGPLGPAGRQALERSYRFAPVEIRISAARIRFSFEHWAQLSPGLRRSALDELKALYQAPENRQRLMQIGWKLQDPFGRVTYTLALAQLDYVPRPAGLRPMTRD